MMIPLEMPTLFTDEIRLRPFTMADIELVRVASSDPHIPLITTVPAEFSHSEGTAWIERQWDRAQTGAGLSFAIAEESTNQAIGQIGLWLRDAALGRAYLGYWVAGPFRGRGVARQALVALSGWAFDSRPLERLELYVEPWNLASSRTAEKAGFTREGLLRNWEHIGSEWRDMYMYSLIRKDPRPSEVTPGGRSAP